MARTHVLATVSANRSLNAKVDLPFDDYVLIFAPMLSSLTQMPIGMEPIISMQVPLLLSKFLPRPTISLIRHRTSFSNLFQGAAERFENWGGTLVAPSPSPSLPSPFPPFLLPVPLSSTISPLPLSPPLPYSSLPPSPFLPSPRPLKAQLGGLGSAVSSPSGSGRSLADKKNRFGVYLR